MSDRLKCGNCHMFDVDEGHECFGKGERSGEYGICEIGTWTNGSGVAGCWSNNGCNFKEAKNEFRIRCKCSAVMSNGNCMAGCNMGGQ